MEVTDATFEQEVLQDRGSVMVQFEASWCPPCQMMRPVVERVRDRLIGHARVVTINIDRNPGTAARFGVSGVPTFAVFSDGRLADTRTGAATEKQLLQLVEDELAKFSKLDPQNVARSPSAPTSDSATNVTVVSGLPRSGTSMMMRMLEAGNVPVLTDGQRRPDEDNPNGYYEFEPVRNTADDSSWISRASGRAVKMVYRLLTDLPGDVSYRVVMMRRRMTEVLASQRRMLHRRSMSSTVPDHEMADLLTRDLSRVNRWIDCQANFTRLDVDFNQLVNSPREWCEQVRDFLDGRPDADSMAAIVDPALYRQRSE